MISAVRLLLVGTWVCGWVAGSHSQLFPLVAQYNALRKSLAAEYRSVKYDVLTEEQKEYSCPPVRIVLNTGENAGGGRVISIVALKKLAEGSGSILKVYREEGDYSGKQYVVKTIFQNAPRRVFMDLINEKAVLSVLKDHPDFPPIYEINLQHTNITSVCVSRLFVTRALGAPIQLKPRLSAGLVYAFAAEALELLRSLHDSGFVHGDVHKGNFVKDREESLHLIDFGMSVPYVDEVGNLLPPLPCANRHAPSYFSSFTSLFYNHVTTDLNIIFLAPWQLACAEIKTYRIGRRDDLFRLAELLYLRSSSKYNQACRRIMKQTEDADEAYEVQAWMKFKTDVPTEKNYNDVPPIVKEFYIYTMSLGFSDAPVYDEWIEKFSADGTWRDAEGEVEDDVVVIQSNSMLLPVDE